MTKTYLIYRRGARGRKSLDVGNRDDMQPGDFVSYFRREGKAKDGSVVYGAEVDGFVESVGDYVVKVKASLWEGHIMEKETTITLDEVVSVSRQKKPPEPVQETPKRPKPEPKAKAKKQVSEVAKPKAVPAKPKLASKPGQCRAWIEVRSGWKQCTTKAGGKTDEGHRVCRTHRNKARRGGEMFWEEPKGEDAPNEPIDMLEFLGGGS